MTRHFCACTAAPGFEGVEARQPWSSYVGGAITAVTNPTPPFGLPRWLICPTGKSNANYIQFPEYDDTGDLLFTVPVSFSEVEILLFPVSEWTFLTSWPGPNWSMQIKGGTGFGYDTHRLMFTDANGVQTAIVNDPFTRGANHVLDVRWSHVNSTILQVWIDKSLKATVVRDCLHTAGDVSYEFTGPVDPTVPPPTPQSSLYFAMPVHHADTASGDRPAPYYTVLAPYMPRGYGGPLPPVDETGTAPGDALNSFGGKDAAAIADDDETTYVGYIPISSTGLGGTWSCDEDLSVGGPANSLFPDVVDYACKWVWAYKAIVRFAHATDPGLIYGRKRAGSYTLAEATPPLSGALRGHSVQQVPGDSQYVDPHTDYFALGLVHNAFDSLNNHVKVYGCWGHLLTEYDPSWDTAGRGRGGRWYGDVEWTGDIQVNG